jgi:hypothetical protein
LCRPRGIQFDDDSDEDLIRRVAIVALALEDDPGHKEYPGRFVDRLDRESFVFDIVEREDGEKFEIKAQGFLRKAN